MNELSFIVTSKNLLPLSDCKIYTVITDSRCQAYLNLLATPTNQEIKLDEFLSVITFIEDNGVRTLVMCDATEENVKTLENEDIMELVTLITLPIMSSAAFDLLDDEDVNTLTQKLDMLISSTARSYAVAITNPLDLISPKQGGLNTVNKLMKVNETIYVSSICLFSNGKKFVRSISKQISDIAEQFKKTVCLN